jgi:E3 ubiquitin-protein ligase synoviolin
MRLLGKIRVCGYSTLNWRQVCCRSFYFAPFLTQSDFLKLTTYLVFFAIIITFYGLPLNIVRDVYITARSFVSRLRALHRYQTATRNMDQRYPNATADEMAAMSDRTCIICRDEMVLHEAREAPVNPDGPNTTPKKLPCGHIFHFYCLRSWLERQQSCPTWFVPFKILGYPS